MLHHEDITKTKEIKIKFKENWLSRDYLISHLEILGYSKIKKRFGSCKKSGICCADIKNRQKMQGFSNERKIVERTHLYAFRKFLPGCVFNTGT